MSSPSKAAGAWARLVRLPAPLLAPADAIAGYALAGGDGWPPPGALAASALLCAAGMALNDVADHARDAVNRPERPIPSGAIGFRAAGIGGAALVVCALGGAWSAGPRAFAVAALLAFAVVGYDFAGKHWGPSAVASIALARAANVALGAWSAGPLGAREVETVAAGAFAYALYAGALVVVSFGEDRPTSRRVREAACMAITIAAVLPSAYFPASRAAWFGSISLAVWLAIPLPGMIRGVAIGRYVGAGVLGYPLLGAVLAIGTGRTELALACAGLFVTGALWREVFGARVD